MLLAVRTSRVMDALEEHSSSKILSRLRLEQLLHFPRALQTFRVHPIFLVTDRVTYKIEKGRVVGTGHCLAPGRGEGKFEDFDCSW